MGLQTRTVKTAAQAAANWSTGVTGAGAKWSDGYLHPKRDPFNPANIDPDAWQEGVSTQEAKDGYANGMANVDVNALTATVNGAGRTKFTSSGNTKQSKVLTFQNAFLPKLSNILQNLYNTAPRGRRGSPENRTRLNNYLDSVAATRGQNH